MSKQKKTGCIVVLFLLQVTLAFGQKPAEEFAIYKTKYPKANAVILKDEQLVDIQVVGDSLLITAEYYEEVIYLGENPSLYARDNIYSSFFSMAKDIEAYTLLPGKRKYDRLDVKDFKESFEMESFVFYADGKEISFNYPSLVKGAKSVLKYKRTFSDPHMLGSFFFQSHLPIDQAKYTVVYDPQVELKTQVFNDPLSRISENVVDRKDVRKQISCIATEMDRVKFEPQSPSFNYLVPSVYFQLLGYNKKNGDKVSILASIGDLYNWYKTFIQGLDQSSTRIDSLAKTIVNPTDTEIEKVRSVFYWVQANIKYIAFEDGMRGFIPHSGEYVLEKRYGDCKDMSSLIVALLQAAGIEAYYTWVGSRKLPYSYQATPSPIVDNHMIATCKLDDKWYFLDATGSYTPLGLPTSMIQGKECLIGRGEDFDVVKIPVIPRDVNLVKDSVRISLENGNLKGQGEFNLTGYAKVFNNYKLIKSSGKDVHDYVNRVLSKGSNKFLVGEYSIENLDLLDRPTKINYDFTVNNYYNEIGDEIYVNLILDQSLIDNLIEERQVPIENEYLYTNMNTTVLALPDNVKVKYLPENESFGSGLFGFKVEYEVLGDKIIARKEFYVDYLIMEPGHFETWNEAMRRYSKACRNAVVLTKK